MIRSFDQLRRGADELMKALENFNRTMQNLNDTAERVNSLLNEFEEPTRAIMPQIARTVSLAEDLATRMSAPIEQVVPGLTRLADTLASPVFASLPTDLGTFVDAINDLVRRMSPLGQLAESATGLFGLRIPGVARSMVPGMSSGGTRRAEPAPVVEPDPAPVRSGASGGTSDAAEARRGEAQRRRADEAQATAAEGGGEAQAAGEDGGGDAQARGERRPTDRPPRHPIRTERARRRKPRMSTLSANSAS